MLHEVSHHRVATTLEGGFVTKKPAAALVPGMIMETRVQRRQAIVASFRERRRQADEKTWKNRTCHFRLCDCDRTDQWLRREELRVLRAWTPGPPD